MLGEYRSVRASRPDENHAVAAPAVQTVAHLSVVRLKKRDLEDRFERNAVDQRRLAVVNIVDVERDLRLSNCRSPSGADEKLRSQPPNHAERRHRVRSVSYTHLRAHET